MSYVIKKISLDRWKSAQAFEKKFAMDNRKNRDDWNIWWSSHFGNYKDLRGKVFPHVLEVGSGPNTNIRFILPRVKFQKVYFEDPLIQTYLSSNTCTLTDILHLIKHIFFKRTLKAYTNQLSEMFFDGKFPVDISSAPLEELPYCDKSMNLIVSINVFDHVYDFDKCMKEIDRVLAPNGIFVIGQDLSNASDLKQCPDSYRDIGHPIKLDQESIDQHTCQYKKVFYKILKREEGRNPQAHYGTYLGIFKKTIK